MVGFLYSGTAFSVCTPAHHTWLKIAFSNFLCFVDSAHRLVVAPEFAVLRHQSKRATVGSTTCCSQRRHCCCCACARRNSSRYCASRWRLRLPGFLRLQALTSPALETLRPRQTPTCSSGHRNTFTLFVGLRLFALPQRTVQADLLLCRADCADIERLQLGGFAPHLSDGSRMISGRGALDNPAAELSYSVLLHLLAVRSLRSHQACARTLVQRSGTGNHGRCSSGHRLENAAGCPAPCRCSG